MKHIIHKVFFIWEYKKEEKWLNEMAAKGLHLTDVGFCRYAFEEGTPGEYQYGLEMLPQNLNHPESRKYIEFMEESGTEHIGTMKHWVYFRRPVTDTPFEIYSDLDNKIKHMQSVYRLAGILAGFCVTAGVVNLSIGLNATSSYPALNLSVAIPCLIFGLFIAFGAGKMALPLKKLKAERKLRE